MLSEGRLGVGFAALYFIEIITHADDLGDLLQVLSQIRYDLGLELDGPGFAGDMRSIDFGDQPVIATVDPSVETMLAHQFDSLTRHIGGHRLLLQYGEVALDKQPAVEAGDRRFNIERIEQHGHAERRPAAGYGETDARLLQRAHRPARPLGQYLFFGDEGAIHVGQHERNLTLLWHWLLRHRSVERPPGATIARQ